MRIGLLGGSFNPAHAGHRHIIDLARRRLRLDQVWLLVSPGNPLKPQRGMAPLGERLASARSIADGRRVMATAIEAAFGTRYTVDTLRRLLRRFPRARFVWIMGADILTQLPRWRRWLEIARRIPFAVLPRPGYNHRAWPVRRRTGWPVRDGRCACGGGACRTFRARPGFSCACRSTPPRPARSAPAKEQCHSQAAETVLARAASRRSAQEDRQADAARGRQDAWHAAQEDDRRRSARWPRRAAARKAEPSALDRLQSVIVGSLEDDKAENVVTLDLAGKASFCDRMVIATGLADRQITAMAEHLSEKLHEAGLKRVQVEGAGGADWVLIDAGDIVVHLFKPEARAMYALEKMWGADLDEAV